MLSKTTKNINFSFLNKIVSKNGELLIPVDGKNKFKFVLLSSEQYNYLRECELDLALLEARKDLLNGQYISSVEQHMERIKNG